MDVEDEGVEELVTILLEHLVPAAGWYRDQVAHRLGISPAALTVLERARVRPTTASRCAAWTTMTPSAMTKVIRKLEAQGHVRRVPSGEHEQELRVELVLHEDRDRVRWSLLHLVDSVGLRDPDGHRIAANTLVHASTALGARAAGLEQQVNARRTLVRRRKARHAAGLR